MRMRAFRDDRGSGTVVAVGIIAGLMVLLSLVTLLGAAAVTKTQAARASDLAALAAADTARGLHAGDPCTVAEQVAARNSAVLQECSVGGEYPTEVTVTVAREVDAMVPTDLIPGLPLTATSTSRAGPPEVLVGH